MRDEFIEELYDLELEDLRKANKIIIARINDINKHLSIKNITKLKVGNKVNVIKKGVVEMTGNIERINRSNCVVRHDKLNVLYSVPAALLQKVE